MRFAARSIRSAKNIAFADKCESALRQNSSGRFALDLAGTGAIVIDQTTGGAVTHVGVALTFA